MHHSRPSTHSRSAKGAARPSARRGLTSTRPKHNPAKISAPHHNSRRTVMNVWDQETHHEINAYGAVEGHPIVATNTVSANFLYLNRPKSLNSLNLEMVRDLTSYMRKWETNPGSLGIVLSGIGDKAFCAGGDILSLYKNGKAWKDNGDFHAFNRNETFFREEYQLNWVTSRLVTPYIAFMNGITMGGGAGLALHGQHKVATQKTLFAMPETAIGFFPDVGASNFLTRLPHNIGMYLALTGDRVKGGDLIHLGLANHFMFTHDYPHLYNRMADDHHSIQQVAKIVNETAIDSDELPKLSLQPHIECIERCFGQPTVPQIIEALKQETKDVEFAQKTLALLDRMSPLSLRVTHEQMTRGSRMDLDECLEMEFDIARNMMDNADFYTGVESVLIKKERTKRPNWIHNNVNDVRDEHVYKYFETPAGLQKLDVIAREPAKGNGWEGIRRITFDEDNTVTAGPCDYQYPMFRPLPQQLHPVEWTTTHQYGSSRDTFHLMYWNYLFKHTWTRFPLTEDPLPMARKMLTSHAQQIDQEEAEAVAASIHGLENIINEDPFISESTPWSSSFHQDLGAAPKKMLEHRAAYLHAKRNLDLAQHPAERKKYQDVIDALTPKNADFKSLFGQLDDQTDKLALEYPMAAFVLSKMRESAVPLPNFLDAYGLLDAHPKSGRSSFFAEEIVTKYPAEHVIAIKQQIKSYYNEMAKLFNLPEQSAPALMSAEFGRKNVDILNVWGTDWQDQLSAVNPDNKLEYGDLFSHFLHNIESMSVQDMHEHAARLGINSDPALVYPDDPQKQQVLRLLMDTAHQRMDASAQAKDAFSLAKLQQTIDQNGGDQFISLSSEALGVNDSLPPDEHVPLVRTHPVFDAPHEDDVNVKNLFSDGEIDVAEDAKFLTNRRRRKLQQIFENELGQLEKDGAVITVTDHGILVENYNGPEELLDSLNITKQRYPVEIAYEDKVDPETGATTKQPFVVRSPEFDDETAEQKILREITVPDADKMLDSDVKDLPIASGGNYQGSLDLFRQLTIRRKKGRVTEDEKAQLETKHAIFIPESAANLEANAHILHRLLTSRIPMPFDRQVNENKVSAFALSLAQHFNPKSTHLDKDQWSMIRRNQSLMHSAIRSAFVSDSATRVTDTGEILPGEIIPASIQKHMKPYEATIQSLPSPELFHASATLTKLTHSFHHLLSEQDKQNNEAIASIKDFSHLQSVDKWQGRQTEYTTAKQLYLQQLSGINYDITRPPGFAPDEMIRNFADLDPEAIPIEGDVETPDPLFQDFVNPGSEVSPMAPLSKEERLARSFLRFIRVPDYSVSAIYPTFNYFLDDPTRHPGRGMQLNFEGANPFADNADAFKINYGDISRPMLPPKFASAIKQTVDSMMLNESEKVCQKL